MAGEAAALLDELMGRTRNQIPGKDVREMDWSDAEVAIIDRSIYRSIVSRMFQCKGMQEPLVRVLPL